MLLPSTTKTGMMMRLQGQGHLTAHTRHALLTTFSLMVVASPSSWQVFGNNGVVQVQVFSLVAPAESSLDYGSANATRLAESILLHFPSA
jgi:hypothetical protein